MKSIIKIKCDICRCKIATWEYIPSDFRYYCEDCIPRGCSCNIQEDGTEEKDDKGRLLPCCEYSYSPNGFTANFLLRKERQFPFKHKYDRKWVNIFNLKFVICTRKHY